MARFKPDALHCLDGRHPWTYMVTLQLISSYFGHKGLQVSYELGNYIPYFQLPSSKSQPNCMLTNWNWNVRFEVAILVAELLMNHGSQSFYSTRKGNSQQCQRGNWGKMAEWYWSKTCTTCISWSYMQGKIKRGFPSFRVEIICGAQWLIATN